MLGHVPGCRLGLLWGLCEVLRSCVCLNVAWPFLVVHGSDEADGPANLCGVLDVEFGGAL